MAIEIFRNWQKGYVLDIHTLSSEYLGENEFGHAMYDTKRSKVGELVYQLKYQKDDNAVNELVDEIKNCIGGIEKFDFIIPVPPSNTARTKQPVILVCEGLSKEFRVPILAEVLVKTGQTKEIKNISETEDRIAALKAAIEVSSVDKIKGKKLLLIDDLYRSGSTLSVATELLYEKGMAKSVFVLALTKTRRNR